MRTELESGAWIEHTAPQNLKARDKDKVSRLVTASMPTVPDGQELPGLAGIARADMLMLQRDAVWAQALTAWSYDLPLPQISETGDTIDNRDSFAELPIDDYDEVIAAMAPVSAKLLRVPSPKGPPTATTSSSNGSSRARRAPSPTG